MLLEVPQLPGIFRAPSLVEIIINPQLVIVEKQNEITMIMTTDEEEVEIDTETEIEIDLYLLTTPILLLEDIIILLLVEIIVNLAIVIDLLIDLVLDLILLLQEGKGTELVLLIITLLESHEIVEEGREVELDLGLLLLLIIKEKEIMIKQGEEKGSTFEKVIVVEIVVGSETEKWGETNERESIPGESIILGRRKKPEIQ